MTVTDDPGAGAGGGRREKEGQGIDPREMLQATVHFCSHFRCPPYACLTSTSGDGHLWTSTSRDGICRFKSKRTNVKPSQIKFRDFSSPHGNPRH